MPSCSGRPWSNATGSELGREPDETSEGQFRLARARRPLRTCLRGGEFVVAPVCTKRLGAHIVDR